MQVLFTLDDFDHESIFLKRGDMHFVLLAALKEHSSLDVTELQETLNTYEPDVFLQHYLDVQKNRGWVALSRGRYSITKKGLNVCDKLDELVGDRVYFSNEDDLEDEEEDSPGSEQGDEDDSPASEAQVFHPHNDRTPVVVMISGATKLIFLEHGDVHFAVLNEVFHEDGALNKNDLDMYLAEGPVYQGYPQRQVQRGWLKLDRDNRYHITEDGKLVHAQLLEKFGESEDYDEDDQDPMQKNEDEPLEIVGAQAREKVYFCITPQTIDHLVSVAVNAENFITDFQQRAVETLTSELSEKLHTFYDQSTSGDFIELVRERFKFDLKSRQGENWVDINPGRKTPIMVRLMAPQRQRQYFHTTESMQELLLKQLDTEILSKILTQTTILDDLQKPSFDLLTRMVGRVLRDSFSINPGPYFKELIQENFKIVLSRKDGNLWYELGN
jgi:predicted transcriptional regulator